MQQLVEYMVKAIVDQPAAVSVTPDEQGTMTVYQIEVAESDIGKVIGRHGRTAGALRTVVDAAAKRQDQQATVDILS